MGMAKKKRTAVVGAGWFGQAHIRNFYDLSKLVAVCDSDKAKLDKIKQQYEEVNVYANVADLLKNEKIEAASVVIPPKFIPPITKQFADAGIDVLMEKPMALSVEELTPFKNYTDVRIVPGFIELFNPVFDKLLEYLPKIGEIISMASKRVGLYPRRDWQMGVIMDLSIHDIYLQEKVINKKIVDACGYKKCYKDDRYADAAFILLDFGTAIGNIESNWLTPSKFRRMYVNGDQGGITIDFITQQIMLRTGIDLQGQNPVTKDEKQTPLRVDEPLKREIQNFLYEPAPKVTLDEGIRALEIALRIVNS